MYNGSLAKIVEVSCCLSCEILIASRYLPHTIVILTKDFCAKSLFVWCRVTPRIPAYSVTNTFEVAEPVDEPHPFLAGWYVGMVLCVFSATELDCRFCSECQYQNSYNYYPCNHNAVSFRLIIGCGDCCHVCNLLKRNYKTILFSLFFKKTGKSYLTGKVPIVLKM